MPRPKKKKLTKIDFSGDFYSDSTSENMEYAVILRSPKIGGKILDITIPNLPEEYEIITAKDVPGTNHIETLHSHIPLFYEDEVTYAGAPIGILVGKDVKALEQLAGKVEVSFSDDSIDEKPTVLAKRTITTVTSQENQELQEIQETKENNDEIDEENQNINLHHEYTIGLSSKDYHEPCGAYVDFDGKNLTVTSPTQWASHLRKNLSINLKIPKEEIKIKKTVSLEADTSNIWNNTIVACQCAVASFKLKKPIILILSREEQKRYVDHPIPVKVSHNTVLSPDGYILSNHVTISVDAGVYNPFVESFLDRLIIAAIGAYKPGNITIEAVAFRTDSPPTVANILGTDSFSFFPLESHIQACSQKLKINPYDFRLKNLFPNILQNRTKLPLIFDNHNILPILEDVKKISSFDRRYLSYSQNPIESTTTFSTIPYRGIGLALAFAGTGYYGSKFDILKQSIGLTLETDGDITIHAHRPSSSVLSIWKKTISNEMNIEEKNIKLDTEFDELDEPEQPDSVAGNISILTQLIKKCCSTIQKQRFRQALPITVTKKLSKSKNITWNKETFSGKPYYTLSWGSAVVEVELDPIVFSVRIRNIWLTIDIGHILDIKQAKQSILRNIADILSNLVEGQPLKAEKIHINFLETDSDPKQLGELVYNILPAAFANAVSLVLNKSITKLPLSGDTIYRGIIDK